MSGTEVQPGRFAKAAGRWHASLRFRTITVTLAVGFLAILLVGTVISAQLRDSLFEDRRDQILEDAAGRADDAQNRFSASAAATSQEAQQLANDTAQVLLQGAGGTTGVALLRMPYPETPRVILDLYSDSLLAQLISPELRDQVATESGQFWQSIAIPVNDSGALVSAEYADQTIPGVVVGTDVTLPLAGDYELYLVYSLESESQTLTLILQVLAVGWVVITLLLVTMSWYLTRSVLNPVHDAAVTAQKLADGDLDQRMQVDRRDELAQLGESFNAMAEATQEKIQQLADLSAMQQRFVSDVSHELRTPLTTIRMATEVLYRARASFPDSQARSVELLSGQLDRFEEMLADLLEISRHDAGAAELDAEEVDLRALVERAIQAAEPLAQEHELVVRRDLPNQRVLVDCDARRVERILRNLLVNAIEHAEGNPIDVALAANPQAAVVVVRDHGVGMTTIQTQRVFDRFWRGDPARARTLGGTGLGLAISLEDARLHGGVLDAWGAPGEGAAFRLALPRRAGIEIPAELPLDVVPHRPEPDLAPPVDPQGPDAIPALGGSPLGSSVSAMSSDAEEG